MWNSSIISLKLFFPEKIHSMLTSLKSRGPEGTSWLESQDLMNKNWLSEEMHLDPNKIRFAFGCSRLAINDTSRDGLQPISSNSERFWTILNGKFLIFLK